MQPGASKKNSPGAGESSNVGANDSTLTEADPASPQESLPAPSDSASDSEVQLPTLRVAYFEDPTAVGSGSDCLSKNKPSE